MKVQINEESAKKFTRQYFEKQKIVQKTYEYKYASGDKPMMHIAFNIDITKCNRSGGTSKPTMNGCIIKIDITHLVIDSFKFKENQLSNVFDFQYCTNIKLSNIEVIHKGVASFKHCANINIDNIVHKFSYSNNVNYGSIQLWGVKNCYIGKIIRHDCGIT